MAKYLSLLVIIIAAVQVSLAQDFPALAVTPSQATVLVGESRPFRAVNRNGERVTNVRWDTNGNAQIEDEDSDALIWFRAPGEYVVHAYGTEGEASATVKVVPGKRLEEGTTKWSVDNLPGCKTSKIAPAVPSAETTNDVFVMQQCPYGTVIRAFTAEGLENWRNGVPPGQNVDASHLRDLQPKALMGTSVCDKLKVGMSKDETAQLAESSKSKPPSDRSANVWILEGEKGECKVTFADGAITKKQKVISN